MSGMNAKTFVDTNVLIYAHDVEARAKHGIAKGVLRDLWSQRAGALSPQVLQEFYVNVTRKIASPLSKASARAVVENYPVWCVDTTLTEISAAFRIEDEATISFWDALIVAAARKAGAGRILTEDLNTARLFPVFASKIHFRSLYDSAYGRACFRLRRGPRATRQSRWIGCRCKTSLPGVPAVR